MIRFRYLPNLQLARPPWVDHQIEACLKGEVVGHITMSHVPRKTWDESLCDPVQFCRSILGMRNATSREAAERHSNFKRFHVDTMFVAYIGVERPYRRRGIARSLYLEGARWVAEKHDLLLAATTLQQPSVVTLWEGLVADPKVPMVKLPDGRWAIRGHGLPAPDPSSITS